MSNKINYRNNLKCEFFLNVFKISCCVRDNNMSLHFKDQNVNVFDKIVTAYSVNRKEQMDTFCRRNKVCMNVRNTLYMWLPLCFKGMRNYGNGDIERHINLRNKLAAHKLIH